MQALIQYLSSQKQNGKSIKAVAAEFGCTTSEVRRAYEEVLASRKEEDVADVTKAERAAYAQRLMNEGCNPDEAAAEAGYRNAHAMLCAIGRQAKIAAAPAKDPEPVPDPVPVPMKKLRLIPMYMGETHTYEVTGDLVQITTRAGDGMSVKKDHLEALAAELTELSEMCGLSQQKAPLPV